MTRRTQANGGDLYRLNSGAKAFMAQPSKQVPTKEMIQSVRECVPGRSNNEIHMVLEYYDHDVDRAIQAFVEDGASEALNDWHHTGNPKSTNKKSKKAKIKSQQADAATAPVLVAVEGAASDHQTSVNGFDVDTRVAMQLAATDDPASEQQLGQSAKCASVAPDAGATASAATAANVQPTGRRNSALTAVNSAGVPGQHNGITDGHSVPPGGENKLAATTAIGSVRPTTGHSIADAPSRAVLSTGSGGTDAGVATVNAGVAVPLSRGPADTAQGAAATDGHRLNELRPGPVPIQLTVSSQAAPTTAAAGHAAAAAVANGSRQLNGTGSGLNPTQHAGPSQAVTGVHAVAHAAQSGHSRANGQAAGHVTGQAAGHVQHSQSASLSKPRAGLEKSTKDLQRQTVSLTHLQLVFNEECEKSMKKIKAVFDDLRLGLNEREADLMYQLDKAKEAGGEIFAHRLKKAAELRMQCERCPPPPSSGTAAAAAHSAEQQLADLRADIKHFVSERKIDEELSHAAHFIVSDAATADLLEVIVRFGEVVPVKSGYTSARRPSASSACSGGTDSEDSATKVQRRKLQHQHQHSQHLAAKDRSNVPAAVATASGATQTTPSSDPLAGTPVLSQTARPTQTVAAPSRHSAMAVHAAAAAGENGHGGATGHATGDSACANRPLLSSLPSSAEAVATEGHAQAFQELPATATARPLSGGTSDKTDQPASSMVATTGGSCDAQHAGVAKPVAQTKQQLPHHRRQPQQQHERPARQQQQQRTVADWSEEVEDTDERQDRYNNHDGYGSRTFHGGRGRGRGRGQGSFDDRWSDDRQHHYGYDQRQYYYDDGRRSGTSGGGPRVYRRSPGSAGGGLSREPSHRADEQRQQTLPPAEPAAAAAAAAAPSTPAPVSGTPQPDMPPEPAVRPQPASLQSNGYREERGGRGRSSGSGNGRGGSTGSSRGHGGGGGGGRTRDAYEAASRRPERASARGDGNGRAAREPSRSLAPSAAAAARGDVGAFSAADAGVAAAAPQGKERGHAFEGLGINGAVEAAARPGSGAERSSHESAPSSSAVSGSGAASGTGNSGPLEKALPQRQPRGGSRGRGRISPGGGGGHQHRSSSNGAAAHRPDDAVSAPMSVPEPVASQAHEAQAGAQ